MITRFLEQISTISLCALLITSCGGSNDSFDTSSSTDGTDGADGDGTETSNFVQTEIPDQNSLTLSFEKLAVEALNIVGETNIVTAFAADRHNNPVPDNTAIKFLTNGGKIEPQCLTTGGECTVVWNDQNPTPASLKAIVIAYTTGEESFTDLNDNDLFDAGEPFTDISEPFFDLNEDGLRDDATEEFVDADADNLFDLADGLFTGEPCVGDTTVCDRVTTLIWRSNSIQLSGSFGDADLSSGLPLFTNTTGSYLVTIEDANNNPMPDGTTVSLSADKGSVTPSTFTLAPLATQFAIQYTSGNTAGIVENLIIDVEAPSGAIGSNLITTSSTLKCDKCEIGGTISGASEAVKLKLAETNEIISVSTSGAFKFTTKIAQGGTYTVSVFDSGTLTCTTSAFTGTVSDNVTNIGVTC